MALKHIRYTKQSQQLEGGKFMSEVRVKENESLDSALRRFKRNCAKDGIMERFVKENTMTSLA